jgi:hypothetical protein
MTPNRHEFCVFAALWQAKQRSYCGQADPGRLAGARDARVESRLREVGATIVAPKRRTPAYLKKFVPEEIVNSAPIIKESASRRSRRERGRTRDCRRPTVMRSMFFCRGGAQGRNRIVLYIIEFTSFLERWFSSVPINVPSV